MNNFINCAFKSLCNSLSRPTTFSEDCTGSSDFSKPKDSSLSNSRPSYGPHPDTLEHQLAGSHLHYLVTDRSAVLVALHEMEVDYDGVLVRVGSKLFIVGKDVRQNLNTGHGFHQITVVGWCFIS